MFMISVMLSAIFRFFMLYMMIRGVMCSVGCCPCRKRHYAAAVERVADIHRHMEEMVENSLVPLDLKNYVDIKLDEMDPSVSAAYRPEMFEELKVFLKPGAYVPALYYGNILFMDGAIMLNKDGLCIALTYHDSTTDTIKLREDLPSEERDNLNKLLVGIIAYHQWLFHQKVAGGITGIESDKNVETQNAKFTIKTPIQ